MLIVVVIVLLANLLLVEAYTNARFAPDGLAPRGRPARVPAAVREGGPIIDTSGEKPRSHRMPDRTIALTFDDGPDPTWTPRDPRGAAPAQVPATFFVVGAQVARHPSLAGTRDEGHEIGAHTFTHRDLADLPAWRRNLEYSQTQMAIAYAAGVTTSLPVRRTRRSPTRWTTTAGRWSSRRAPTATHRAHRHRQPGLGAAGRRRHRGNATPKDDEGAIVLLHDAGGDRAQTVAASTGSFRK